MASQHAAQAGGEDLNLWNIVGRMFDKAAANLNIPEGLLKRAEHSQHRKPTKGGVNLLERITRRCS